MEDKVDIARKNSSFDNGIKQHSVDMSSESMENTSDSDSENSVDQEEYPEESVVELMMQFSIDLDQIVYENYTHFIDRNPDGITNSPDNQGEKSDDADLMRALPASLNVAVDPILHTGGMAGAIRGSTGRRRSILPCASNALSSADLERLQKVADENIQSSQSLSMNKSVCRRAVEFLESSTEMHPLRMAKAKRAEEKLYNSVRKLQYSVDDKEKRIETLRGNIANTIILINEHTNGQRATATKSLKSRETKLKSDRDKCKRLLATKSRHDKHHIQMLLNEMNTIQRELNDLQKTHEISMIDDKKVEEHQKNLQRQQKELKRLTKATKKDRQSIDELLVKLSCARKEEQEHSRVNLDVQGDTVEAIRHEIRKLRDQRDRLTSAQCELTQRLEQDKRLSDQEKRKILEYDVTKEVIDDAMELKNLQICGRDVTDHNSAFIDNPDMLSKLNECETRTLLRKCIKKIVDLRDSSWQLEVQVIQYEHDRKEWQLRELNLLNRLKQLQLENEQHQLQMSRQYEKMFTQLLQAAANRYATTSPSPVTENNAMLMLTPAQDRFQENVLSKSQQGLHLRSRPSPHFQAIEGKLWPTAANQ